MRIGDTSFPLAMTFPPPAQIVPTEPAVIIQSQQLPQPTTMIMPGIVDTAQLTQPNTMGNSTDLTPQDLLKPLPSIVDNQPVQVAQCNSFAQWVDQNPLMAAGLLLGLAWFTFKKGN